MIPFVRDTIKKYNEDETRLMDILIDIQAEYGYISKEVIQEIAEALNISQVDVEQTVSFYHFFTQEPVGNYSVYLNNSAVANMMGRAQVAKAFEQEVGCIFGEVSSDGLIGLHDTSCIGMNDQEPAAIINGAIFTQLTPYRVKEIVADMKSGKAVADMHVEYYGGGHNNSDLIHAIVNNNIRRVGPILKDDYEPGDALKKIVTMTPEQVIQVIKDSNLRGRGGAGFPTGLKWDFCRRTASEQRYVFCNADEGEPGTFKDRIILTERPHLIFEGMTLAGYAIGATEGVIYVRYEYKYLEKYLNAILADRRKKNLLGDNILGKAGFNFDIRIQYGGGAYICGEESALIESAEGKRGEPRDRPPFPVERGYLNMPTVVNNVETLSTTVKIILKGADWYKSLGTKDSTGTKLLSISGDCQYPGVYEVEWGFKIRDLLDMVGAHDVQAVQVGGPSGQCVGPEQFDRCLCYADLATGGSVIVIGKHRDLLKDVVLNFTEFFVEESCGNCVPCRVMPMLLKDKLEKIIKGRGVQQDLAELEEWTQTMQMNRCGLGLTAANPIVTSLKNFRRLYESKLQTGKDYDTGFDLHKSVLDACLVTGRSPHEVQEPHHRTIIPVSVVDKKEDVLPEKF